MQPGDTVTDQSSPAKVSEQLSLHSFQCTLQRPIKGIARGDLVRYPVVPGTPVEEDRPQEEVEGSGGSPKYSTNPGALTAPTKQARAEIQTSLYLIRIGNYLPPPINRLRP